MPSANLMSTAPSQGSVSDHCKASGVAGSGGFSLGHGQREHRPGIISQMERIQPGRIFIPQDTLLGANLQPLLQLDPATLLPVFP